MKASRITFRIHAIKRMFRRSITNDEVRDVLENGEVIEDYPTDTPYPSQLILGRSGGRLIHIVAAYNAKDDEAIIITAYEPDPNQWDSEFKRRKP
jgi:hypothetical protein